MVYRKNLHHKGGKNESELKNNIGNHMLMLQGNRERVKKYFKHEDIRYAA